MSDAELKRVPHGGDINVSAYEFSSDDELDGIIADKCNKVIRQIFEAPDELMIDTPYAYLPWEWSDEDGISGTKPDDPLTIYVRLPLHSGDDEMPTWSFSLNECITDAIALYSLNEPDEPGEYEEIPPTLIAIRDALRAAAQRIDDAVTSGEREQ